MRAAWRIMVGGLAVVVGLGGLTAAAPDTGAVTTTTLYVAAAGSDAANTCATASDPCATVQRALREAAGISGTVVVTVGAGTYGGAGMRPPTTASLDETAVTVQAHAGTAVSLVGRNGAPALTDAVVRRPLLVVGLTLQSTRTDGLSAADGATVTLTEVTVSTFEVDGVAASGGTTRVAIAHCTIAARSGLGAVGNGQVAVMATAASVEVNDDTISGNYSGVVEVGGTVDVVATTVSGNTGTGIIGAGGGVTVSDSDVSDNRQTGFFVYSGATATVTATTVSGNGSFGFEVEASSAVEILGSTIGTNDGVNGYDDLIAAVTSTITVAADLLSGAPACFATPSSAIVSAGYNVVASARCTFSGPTTTSLQTVAEAGVALGPLAPDGGPTRTRAIAATSVANDRVPAAATAGGVTLCAGDDQRGSGFPRLPGGATSCAAGAFQPTPALVVATSSLPAGAVGSPYAAQLAAAGGDGTYSWSLTSGDLPPGIALDADGALSGTPGTPGSSSFTVTVTDGEGQTASAPLSISVAGVATTPTPPAGAPTGYDLVGSDGGVFVFDAPGRTGGFFGSLPGLGVVPDQPVTGMVPTADGRGYLLVAGDGGVFAFGDAPFLGSLPGLGVTPGQPVVGIVATDADKGYLLVGRDGGVYAFGTAAFLGSLPGEGRAVSNVVGIAATPSGSGYWVARSTGAVTAFGGAASFATPATTSPVAAIVATTTGQGYWLVTEEGGVFALGNAGDASPGTLRAVGVVPSLPVVAMVPDGSAPGYRLAGADGGIFAFGTAPFYGSLPGLGIEVTDIVGAVPT